MEERERIQELVRKTTSRTNATVEEEKLLELRRLAKKSEDNVQASFDSLFDRMKMRSCQNRYLSLWIVDDFFCRSKVFRRLVVDILDECIALTIGHLPNRPLPGPSKESYKLQTFAFEVFHRWNEKFGKIYREISLAEEFLCKHPDFRNIYKAQAPGSREIAEQEERERSWDWHQYQELSRNFDGKIAEIRSVLGQIHSCFDMLEAEDVVDYNWGRDKQFCEVEIDESGMVWEPVESIGEHEGQQLPQNAIDANSVAIEFYPDVETNKLTKDAALHDTLRDLEALVRKKFLVQIQNWLGILTRVQEQGANTHALRRYIMEYECLLKSAMVRIGGSIGADAVAVPPATKARASLS